MKTPEIGSLVTGVLTIVGLAITLGQYGKLETWARHQAMEAMLWKRGLPYFFAPVGSSTHKVHKNGHSGVRRHGPTTGVHPSSLGRT